jgi:hypothetical protein
MFRRFGQLHIVRHELIDRISNAARGSEMNCIEASEQKWLQVSGVLKQFIIQTKQEQSMEDSSGPRYGRISVGTNCP